MKLTPKEIEHRCAQVEEMAALGFLSKMGRLKLLDEIQDGMPVYLYYGYSGPHATRTAYIACRDVGRMTAKTWNDDADWVWPKHLRRQVLEEHYKDDPQLLMYMSSQDWWEEIVDGTYPVLGQMSADELRDYLNSLENEAK